MWSYNLLCTGSSQQMRWDIITPLYGISRPHYKALTWTPCCNAASLDRSWCQTHMHAKHHRAQAHALINCRRNRFQVQKRSTFYFHIFRTFSQVMITPRAPLSHYTDTVTHNYIPATPFTVSTLPQSLPTS